MLQIWQCGIVQLTWYDLPMCSFMYPENPARLCEVILSRNSHGDLLITLGMLNRIHVLLYSCFVFGWCMFLWVRDS